MRDRLGSGPVYVSVDIDVLDPAHAPGTGTPEAGGLTSRELLGILRGLAGAELVSADIVEVSPPYDHAELTGIAARRTSATNCSRCWPADPDRSPKTYRAVAFGKRSHAVGHQYPECSSDCVGLAVFEL